MSDLKVFQPLKSWLEEDSNIYGNNSSNYHRTEDTISPYCQDSSLGINRKGPAGGLRMSPDQRSNHVSAVSVSPAPSRAQGSCLSSCLKGSRSPDSVTERAGHNKDKPGSSGPYLVRNVTSLTHKPPVERPIPIPIPTPTPSPAQVLVADKKQKHKPAKEDFIWAEKYRPKVLQDFIYHRGIAQMLLKKVGGECYSHLIFEGSPGSGKRTMILALLREVYGPDKLEITQESRHFNLEGEPISSIQLTVQVSFRHVEVNLSDIEEEYAAQVVMGLIAGKHTTPANHEKLHSNRTVIILEKAETLPIRAQLHIRSFLETYKGLNKVVFCCSSIFKLQHLRSLCSVIQFFPPLHDETVEVLKFIANKEGIKLPHRLAKNIARESNYSLQQAIRSFEATWRLKYPFQEDQTIVTGWEEELASMAKKIIEEQSPKQLYIIRGKLQILNEYHICPEFIFKILAQELQKHIDDRFRIQITDLCHEYTVTSNRRNSFDGARELLSNEVDKRIQELQRRNVVPPYLRIEEFVAKFMSIYKSLLYNLQEHRRAQVARYQGVLHNLSF